MTLDKNKSRSAGATATRFSQSAKKGDVSHSIRRFEEATRRITEWQKDKPGTKLVDYSRTPSRVDTGLSKSFAQPPEKQ